MTRVALRHDRAILIASLVFLAFALLVSGRAWLQRATAPAPRPHAVLRVALPGLDLGADAWPAHAGAAGYVEVWAMPAGADDYRPLFQVMGAPAPWMEPKWVAPRPDEYRHDRSDAPHQQPAGRPVAHAAHHAGAKQAT